MELFARLFGGLLLFVYHCFDRVVIHGYLSGLSRPEQVVYFFREVVGVPAITREVLSQRTRDYQNWVEAFARNRGIPLEWAESGVRKQDHLQLPLRRMNNRNQHGVYCILKSMEQGSTFRSSAPKYPTADLNTASSPASAAASHTTTSTSATRSWDRWSCAWPASFPFRPLTV
jgi:hypothetical protein